MDTVTDEPLMAFKLVNKEVLKETKVTRGLVHIVTNNFKKMKESVWQLQRVGWKNDMEKICSTFEAMEYQVKKTVNCQKSQILNDLKTVCYTSEGLDGKTYTYEPELLFVIVMSHGGENGTIYTDYSYDKDAKKLMRTKGRNVKFMSAFESYSTKEVFDALRNNPNLKNCLKVVIFQACRGKLPEVVLDPAAKESKSLCTDVDLVNKNSSRFPLVNLPANTTVIYASVEGTLAMSRENKKGSLLVWQLCKEIDEASDGKEFLEIITSVFGKICDASIKLTWGQTAEVLCNASTSLVLQRSMKKKTSKKKDPTEEIDNYHKWDDCNYVKGYAAVIKLNSLFAENNLVHALDTNLGLDVQVFSTTDDQSKIEDAVVTIADMSTKAAFLIVLIVGKLVPSDKSFKEVCLATKSGPIPINEVMRRFVGTSNFHLIGKPKFFIFIDDGNQSKKVYLPPEKTFRPDSQEASKIFTNHSYNMTVLCVGKDDLRTLEEQLSKPDLRHGGCVLQSLLAECVQRCNSGKDNAKLKEIHTSFISTIPKLVSLPNFKNTYVPPIIGIPREGFITCPMDLGLQYWSTVAGLFFPKSTNSKVKPPRINWLIVHPPGHGKTRFTYELEKVLKKNNECTEVVRVNLRKYCDYFNDCEVGKATLTWHHFLSNQNNIRGGKMAFIFDGYEKVALMYSNIVSSLFMQIFKEKKPHSILVTSRPKVTDQLLRELLIKIPFIEVNVQPFLIDKRKQYLGHQLSLQPLDENVTKLLSLLEQMLTCDCLFLGNAHHLQVISQFGVDVNESHMFAMVAAVLRSLVSKALVKIESVGSSSHLLNTKITQRQRLLVAAAAHLEGLPFCQFSLTPERIEEINNVGIMTICERENNRFEFSFVTFRCFLLASACLAHLNSKDNPLDENQVRTLLEQNIEKDNEIALVWKFVYSFQEMSSNQNDSDPVQMSSLIKSLISPEYLIDM